MICFDPPQISSVPITNAVSQLRRVDPNSAAVQAARALGINFGDCTGAESPFSGPWATSDADSMFADVDAGEVPVTA